MLTFSCLAFPYSLPPHQAYSLWIYDCHCTLIYHHDWSLSPSSALQPGPDLLPGVSRSIAHQPLPSSSTSSAPGPAPGAAPTPSSLAGSSALALTDQAKLIYGLVFSLRNMLAKLSPSAQATSTSHFNTYTTPTYALGHYQTASMYTFVLLTDPVSPPVRAGAGGRGSGSGAGDGQGYSIGSGGGGIPGTGGMSLPGVLKQIAAGPWVEWVVKNPAMDFLGGGLETEEIEDVDLDEEEQERGGEAGQENGEDEEDGVEERPSVRGEVKKVLRRRGVDSDGLRGAVEAGE